MKRLSKHKSELAARLITASSAAQQDATDGLIDLVDEDTHEKIMAALNDQGLAVLYRHGFDYPLSYAQIIEYVQIGHRP